MIHREVSNYMKMKVPKEKNYVSFSHLEGFAGAKMHYAL